MWYNRQVNESWPLSQTVKTSPSHGEDMGSIPVGVTTGSFKDEAANLFRAISSAGRAPGSQSGGQGFDPPMVHQRSTPPPRRWGASLVDRVCFRERTPSAVAEPNGRIAMIALRRCVNPPIPGGMNVRSEHLKNSLTYRRTFRFRSPYGPPAGSACTHCPTGRKQSRAAYPDGKARIAFYGYSSKKPGFTRFLPFFGTLAR